jgi:hypothetical protein
MKEMIIRDKQTGLSLSLAFPLGPFLSQTVYWFTGVLSCETV